MNKRDEWNRLMRNLPDSVFMEIMNNYLGGVQTPYDKNELLARLAGFLTLPANTRKIALRISSRDLKILSAIQWFDHPDHSTLIDFFSGILSPSTIRSSLMNLEERLLIFFDKTGHKMGLILSPLIPDEIRGKLGPVQFIRFRNGSVPAPAEIPLINGSFLICFLSLLNEDSQICNSDGSIKKRFTASLIRVFPSAGFTDEPNEVLHLLLNSLKTLSLLKESGREWRLKVENLKKFSARNRKDQLLWLWGALCTRERSRVSSCSQLIASLADQIPEGAALNEKDLETLILLLSERLSGESASISPGHIIRVLKRFGFFLENNGIYSVHPMIPSFFNEESQAAGTLFLHATFDANLTPDTPFSLPLSLVLKPDRYDSFAQLKISDASFRRFLKAGLSLEELEEDIRNRFQLSLPQNIRFSLKDWEEDYYGLRLWEGVILEVRPDRIPLIQQNSRLLTLIRRKLAEGVYLLAAEDRREWEDAMHDMGIETIPRTESPGRKISSPADYALNYETLPSLFPDRTAGTKEDLIPPLPDEELQTLFDCVEKEGEFSDEEKEEMRGRISRGVVYAKDQIRPGMIRREITTVKGLDYQGKLRMIQSVLGNRAYQLEITLPTDDYDLIIHRIIPRSLEQEKESQAMLTGTEVPDKPFQCPVRKISRIRKIRSSLF